MTEIQWYMEEIVNLYETPPTPPIPLTSLVKAWEVVNFLNIDGEEMCTYNQGSYSNNKFMIDK